MIITFCLSNLNKAPKETYVPQEQPTITTNEESTEDKVVYCRKCGEKLLDRSQFCSKCGTKLLERSQFCRKCGTEIVEETSAMIIEIEETEFCKKCGADITNDTETCHVCGEHKGID